MVRVEPGEKGEYTLLGTEGFEDDGRQQILSGLLRSQPQLALELAADNTSRTARTIIRFSLLEDRMVGDFVLAHPNIAGGQS